MKWARHVANRGGRITANMLIVGKREGKRLLRKQTPSKKR
jgi:hypothetical protein